MSARCQFLDNLLMTQMDAVKDANGQPGFFEINFFKGPVMLHAVIIAASLSQWDVCAISLLVRGEEDLLGLPGRVSIFTCNSFHQCNELALCTDATGTVSNHCIFRGLDTMPMTHTFYIIRTEFESRPVTQRFRGGD